MKTAAVGGIEREAITGTAFRVFKSPGAEDRFDEDFIETAILQHAEFGQLPSNYRDEHGSPLAVRSSAHRSEVFVVLPEELDELQASFELRELNEQTVMES